MNLDGTIAPSGALALVIGAAGVSTAILSLAVALTACGGGGDAGAETTSPVAATFAITPVFDDDGHPSATARSAEPADPDVRTRAGLYASADQYRWVALTSSPSTVLVDLDTSEPRAATIDHALAARDQSPSSARQSWFVKSADARAGARVADTLTSMGLNPVFLVVGGLGSAR